VEDLALPRQRVDARRELAVASVGAQTICAQGVDADQQQQPVRGAGLICAAAREQEQQEQGRERGSSGVSDAG